MLAEESDDCMDSNLSISLPLGNEALVASMTPNNLGDLFEDDDDDEEYGGDGLLYSQEEISLMLSPGDESLVANDEDLYIPGTGDGTDDENQDADEEEEDDEDVDLG